MYNRGLFYKASTVCKALNDVLNGGVMMSMCVYNCFGRDEKRDERRIENLNLAVLQLLQYTTAIQYPIGVKNSQKAEWNQKGKDIPVLDSSVKDCKCR